MSTPIYSDTNKVSLAISAETAGNWGATPSTPAMTPLRYTAETMTPSKKTTVSTIIRADRQRQFLAEVAASAGGDISLEYSFGGLDLIMLSTFMNNFVTCTSAAAAYTIAVTGSTATITRSTGSFVTDGYTPFMFCRIKGATNAGNNSVFQVTAVAALVLTVQNYNTASMVAETTPATATVFAKSLTNGTTFQSFLMEAQYNDISQFIQFLGCAVDTMSFDIKSGSIITAKGKIMAKQGTLSTATVAASLGAVDTSQILTASANMGNIYENGTALATAMKSLTLEINNNMREKPAIGTLYPVGMGLGFCDVTGTFDAYFADMSQMTLFINHTSLSLIFQFSDAAGNIIVFSLPSLYLEKAEPTIQGGNQDVMVQCGFHAILDTASNTTIRVDYLHF
jgi:hypothetical protein